VSDAKASRIARAFLAASRDGDEAGSDCAAQAASGTLARTGRPGRLEQVPLARARDACHNVLFHGVIHALVSPEAIKL
jgi:hypothetical protein